MNKHCYRCVTVMGRQPVVPVIFMKKKKKHDGISGIYIVRLLVVMAHSGAGVAA